MLKDKCAYIRGKNTKSLLKKAAQEQTRNMKTRGESKQCQDDGSSSESGEGDARSSDEDEGTGYSSPERSGSEIEDEVPHGKVCVCAGLVVLFCFVFVLCVMCVVFAGSDPLGIPQGVCV